MAWPPTLIPPNNRSNETEQLNNHAPDHNAVSNTLSTEFVPQVSANLAATGVNAGNIAANAGNIATNTGNVATNTSDIAIARQNFLPGGTPSVRGNSVRLREADNTDIGSGFVTSVEVSRHIMTGPDLSLNDNVYTVLNGTTVLAVAQSVRPVTYLVTATFDFGAIGTSGLCQGSIDVDGVPSTNTATLLSGQGTNITRATVASQLVVSSGVDVEFSLSARTLPGTLGTCFTQGTLLTILKISS